MSTFELALNCLYAKDGQAIYRNFSNTNINVRQMLRNLYKHYTGEDTPKDDTDFDELMYDDLQFDLKDINGLLAFLYMNLWSKTELYERLKYYEDLEEQGLLLRLPCKIGSYIYIIYETKIHRELVENISVSVKFGDVVLHLSGYPISRVWGSDLGKKYFLTREEAEKKLQELEGE